jgi:carbon monoxide dehydrogenase subunit G
MPGYRECEIIDENDSRWTLKVGVGRLVRTVKVQVHVDEWAGPETVRFTFKLAGDPVHGGGTYVATATGSNETQIALKVHVIGTGPMAPMWEAMGKPLLPQFARSFAEQLRDEIEKSVVPDPKAEVVQPVTWQSEGGVIALLLGLWRKLIG